MLAADEGLAEQMVRIAEEGGQTLFSLVNGVLEKTVRAHDIRRRRPAQRRKLSQTPAEPEPLPSLRGLVSEGAEAGSPSLK